MSCIVKQKRKAANGETIYYAYEISRYRNISYYTDIRVMPILS